MTTDALESRGKVVAHSEPVDDKTVSRKDTAMHREGTATPAASMVSTSSEESGSNQHHLRRRLPALPQKRADPHPPGFWALATRVDKFSGKQAEDNFEVWLQDYVEATEDCGWDNQKRARWFSWFLTGPAKATWQQKMLAEDKADWDKITKAYHGQYGVHLDPRTVYQRCHDLQYEQFDSVQGLLNAMREHQSMAPLKLTNEVL